MWPTSTADAEPFQATSENLWPYGTCKMLVALHSCMLLAKTPLHFVKAFMGATLIDLGQVGLQSCACDSLAQVHYGSAGTNLHWGGLARGQPPRCCLQEGNAVLVAHRLR